ncbi:hypothetical protein FQA47_024235 [Oryzias melastigma]|uniref:Uncharacterized protein n=1 Tax=Oryzias melastigma TaxID=30732 RepID=A0A834BVI9_ORYME|nr:hypothetical protein FQA47_024235 [Oryzias melastigma]
MNPQHCSLDPNLIQIIMVHCRFRVSGENMRFLWVHHNLTFITGESVLTFIPTGESVLTFIPTGESVLTFILTGESVLTFILTGESVLTFILTGESVLTFILTGESVLTFILTVPAARSQSTRKSTPGRTRVRTQGEFGSSNRGPVLDTGSGPIRIPVQDPRGAGPVNGTRAAGQSVGTVSACRFRGFVPT